MARKKLNSASKKNNIEKSSAKDEPKIKALHELFSKVREGDLSSNN